MHPELVKVIGPHILSEGRGDTNCRPWMSWLLRPSAAAYLNTSQLMCLTGLDPAEHVKAFDALETQRASDIDMLIGNAMNVPVGWVAAPCALSMVDLS